MQALRTNLKTVVLEQKVIHGLQFFFNLENYPTFLSEERLVNLERGREICVGLYLL